MADQDIPSRASNMEKAEGDRDDDSRQEAPETRYQERDRGAGITNRPIDEEIENQKEVPERGESKPDAHAG